MPKLKKTPKKQKKAVKKQVLQRKVTIKNKVSRLFQLLTQHWALVITALIIAAILRLYRLEENIVFHGELGHNYLAMRDIAQAKQIPLLGPPTSHPWLSFGPFYYWIFTPILVLSGYNPVVISYVFALLGVFTVWVNYVVIKKLFSPLTALYSTFILASSPLWVNLARESRFFSIVTLLMYPFLYFLILGLKSGKRSLIPAGLLFGIMLNFHLSPLILLPYILGILFFKHKKVFLKKLGQFLLGVLFPTLPFLIYSAMNNFEMLTKVLMWVPYRVAGFVGIGDKNNFSFTSLNDSFTSLYDVLYKSIFAQTNAVGVGVVFLFVYFCVLVFQKVKIPEGKVIWRNVILLFITGTAAIFIHGSPPYHYFLPLFPLIILIFAGLLTYISKYNSGLVISWAFIVVTLFLNLGFYASDKWFFIPNDRVETNISFSVQKEVSEEIVKDAQGADYTLRRIGFGDHFEDNYAQNYHFLLWKNGNQPKKDSEIIYVISEEEEAEERNYIYNKNGVYVWRQENGD